jgi:hypothetical protein
VIFDDVFSGLDSKSMSLISTHLFSNNGNFRTREYQLFLLHILVSVLIEVSIGKPVLQANDYQSACFLMQMRSLF